MIQPWKLLQEEVLFENQYAKLEKRTYEMPDGREADYFIRGNTQSVASIFAVDKKGQIILAREFRPGPDKVLDELPGGLVDEGEEPLQAAKRELLEETGYEGEMTFLGNTYVSAYSSKEKFFFIALNCEEVAEKKEDENEFIHVVLKSPQEFEEQVKSGELTDLASALLGLNYLRNL